MALGAEQPIGTLRATFHHGRGVSAHRTGRRYECSRPPPPSSLVTVLAQGEESRYALLADGAPKSSLVAPCTAYCVLAAARPNAGDELQAKVARALLFSLQRACRF